MTDENKPSFEREITWELRARDLESKLAAMTRERDEAVTQQAAWRIAHEGLERQYKALIDQIPSEMIQVDPVLAEQVKTASALEEIGRKQITDLQSQLATLQATLAERERDIAKLKAELNETFVDEKETVWTRPTAWAYAMVCKARDKHEQEAGRLRNNVELMARDMCSMPSDLYQEWLDSDSQVHFRQWLAERALKGDEPTVEEKVRQACERGEVWDGVRWLTKDEASNLKGDA